MAYWARISSVGIALALLAGGCGDDKKDTASTDTTQSTDTTVTSSAQGTGLSAVLTGAGETTPGDADGAGTAKVTVDEGKGEVCYEVAVQHLDQPVGMHIHEEAAGKSGPVVVPLTMPSSGDANATGCANVDAAVITRILANPAGFYVNVHTALFPQGAVRGQLQRG